MHTLSHQHAPQPLLLVTAGTKEFFERNYSVDIDIPFDLLKLPPIPAPIHPSLQAVVDQVEEPLNILGGRGQECMAVPGVDQLLMEEKAQCPLQGG